MEKTAYNGFEFMEAFSMLALVLWVVGALALAGVVVAGQGRMNGAVSSEPNQTPVAESTATQ